MAELDEKARRFQLTYELVLIYFLYHSFMAVSAMHGREGEE